MQMSVTREKKRNGGVSKFTRELSAAVTKPITPQCAFLPYFLSVLICIEIYRQPCDKDNGYANRHKIEHFETRDVLALNEETFLDFNQLYIAHTRT